MAQLVGQHRLGLGGLVGTDQGRVDDDHRIAGPHRHGVHQRGLGDIEVGRELEIQDISTVQVARPEVGQLIVTDTDGVTEQDLAQTPLVAEIAEPLDELVHERDGMKSGGGGPVGGVFVGLGADPLVTRRGSRGHDGHPSRP